MSKILKTIGSMKKKLNVFCVLMLVLMAAKVIIGIILSFDEHAQAFKQGWEDGGKEEVTYTFGFWGDMLLVVLGLVCFYLMIRALISFVRFILNVNRDKVFVWENVPLLRWTGWGLLITTLIMTVHDLMVQVPVDKIYNGNSGYYIFSVFCLIVAEVFAIGLKLKEEQDLTI